jgi:uncharacterized protein YqgV (UPF0045/DUF77 family)
MEIGVEISLYPLAEEFGPPIKAFLERLRAAGRLKVVTTSLSTQVFGEYEEVLGVLTREMRAALEAAGADGRGGAGGKAVFLLKVFGPLAAP